MKKISILFIVTIFSVLLLTSGAQATVYNFTDDIKIWPNQTGSNLLPNTDENGDPKLSGMTVTTDANGYLTSIKINFTSNFNTAIRYFWDSLFINSNWDQNMDNFDEWDYYVKRPDMSDDDVFSAYNVGSGYEYTHVGDSQTYPYGGARTGHVNGLNTTSMAGLTPGSFLTDVDFDYVNDHALTYYFANGAIYLGGNFVIGYTESCANDVLLATHAPIPGAVWLLGSGLVGLVGLRRKFIS